MRARTDENTERRSGYGECGTVRGGWAKEGSRYTGKEGQPMGGVETTSMANQRTAHGPLGSNLRHITVDVS